MATLTGQSIADSYEQLLSLPDGGGNGTSHVALTDGDGVTTFPITLATDALMITSTNRLEFGTNATYVYQVGSNILGLVAGSEIDLTATAIDINGTGDVSGTLTVGGVLTVNNGAVFNEASADVNFRIEDTNNLNAFFVEGGAASGMPRIGIGTAAPATVLHTLSTAGDNIFTVEARNNAQIILHNNYATHSSANYDSSIKFLSRPASGDGSAAGWLLGQDHGNAQKFKLSFASGDPTAPAFGTNDYLTVDVSGKIGIGTASPAHNLHIIATDTDSYRGLYILDTSDSACDTSNIMVDLDYEDDADLDGAYFIRFQDNDGEIGEISGNLNTTTYATSSDYRLKVDYKDIVDATGTINQLKLYDFAWKKNENKRAMGVIAHEAQAIVPTAITGIKDAMTKKDTYYKEGDNIPEGEAVGDVSGEKDVIKPQCADYSKFVPLLLKSVQELSASNDALKARIEVLEG